MLIFQIKNNIFTPVNEKRIDLEKDLQKLVENNLKVLFELEFVSTEFNIENFWIDTLAFDPSTKSFVIIEYKKVENFSLMDQGQTYLNLALDHKAELILEYNEKYNRNLKRSGVDWGQTRVIFIGPKFNNFQKRALHPNLPFELWEVSLYENNFVSFYQILPVSTSSRPQNARAVLTGKAAKEIKTFSVEDHKKQTTDNLNSVFENLRSKILELDSLIKEKPVSWYVGYQYKGYLIAYVQFYKDKLMVNTAIRKPEDPLKRLIKAPKSWQGWTTVPQWRFKLTKNSETPYLMTLIEQSYKMRGGK